MLRKFYTKAFLLTNSADASNWANIKPYFRLLWGKLESQKWNKMKTIYLVALSNNEMKSKCLLLILTLHFEDSGILLFWFLHGRIFFTSKEIQEEGAGYSFKTVTNEKQNNKQKASQGLRGPPVDQYARTHLFRHNHSI